MMNQCHFNIENIGFLESEITAFLAAHKVSVGNSSKSLLDTPPTDSDLDPTDLPEELDMANMAFRAVFNGYGNPADTFRNRLIKYLNSRLPAQCPTAIKRIATVANPDKERGRPTKIKE